MSKKLESLIKEALDSCEFRGHKMVGVRIFADGTKASSTCIVCGKGIYVETNPMPNGIDISGEAIALNCKD